MFFDRWQWLLLLRAWWGKPFAWLAGSTRAHRPSPTIIFLNNICLFWISLINFKLIRTWLITKTNQTIRIWPRNSPSQWSLIKLIWGPLSLKILFIKKKLRTTDILCVLLINILRHLLMDHFRKLLIPLSW